MNRISTYIPSNKVRYSKSVGKFDYRMLMNLNYDFTVSSESQVIRSYDYWNKRQYLIRPDTEMHQKQEDVYMYQQFRLKIIEETGQPLGYIVNSLVAFLYTVRNSSMKKMLWACFGDVIVENIKRNLANGSETRICEICGRRFEPSRITQIYCSKDCYIQADREKARIRKSSYKTQPCVNIEESILNG